MLYLRDQQKTKARKTGFERGQVAMPMPQSIGVVISQSERRAIDSTLTVEK